MDQGKYNEHPFEDFYTGLILQACTQEGQKWEVSAGVTEGNGMTLSQEGVSSVGVAVSCPRVAEAGAISGRDQRDNQNGRLALANTLPSFPSLPQYLRKIKEGYKCYVGQL